jgi:hypothetical protein
LNPSPAVALNAVRSSSGLVICDMRVFETDDGQLGGKNKSIGTGSDFGSNIRLPVFDLEVGEVLLALEGHDDESIIINVISRSYEHDGCGAVRLAFEIVASVGLREGRPHCILGDGYMGVVVIVLEFGGCEIRLASLERDDCVGHIDCLRGWALCAKCIARTVSLKIWFDEKR